MENRIISLATIVLLAVALVASPVFAAAPKLSETQKAGITTNCGAIRQKLENLQRMDSKTYSYYQAIYETAATRYIKPLNLRLVDNNKSNQKLLDLQTGIATSEKNFSDDFIAYNKLLDSLKKIDCKVEPETFYEKLIEVRVSRAILKKDIEKLNELVVSAVKSAETLKGSLK